MFGGDFAHCRGKIANFAGCPPPPPPRAPEGWSTGFAKNLRMGLSSASVLLSKSIGTAAGLGWAGPGWAALGWAGLGRAGPGGAGGRQRGQGTHVRKNIHRKIRACVHATPNGLGWD